MPLIKTDQLTKNFSVIQRGSSIKDYLKSLFTPTYTEKTALKNITLSINEGEMVGLVGANGAGKTTLIKLLSGIIYPTSGNAEVLSETPWERSVNFRKNIALVMGQKAQLWWDLPADDGFILLKEIYKISDNDFNQRKNLLIDTLGVSKLTKTPVRKLSLGERMKMELVAALLHSPKVLYLDEPTIGLDFSSQKAIRGFLLNYVKEYSPAVIVTSHYMADIKELCDRILIIRSGELVYDGLLSGLEKHTEKKLIRISEEFNKAEFVSFPDIKFEELESETLLHVDLKIFHLVIERVVKLGIVNFTVENEDITEIIQSIMVNSELTKVGNS